jgi:hypothetical protein
MARLAAGDGERDDHVHDWTQNRAVGIHTRQPVLYRNQFRQSQSVAKGGTSLLGSKNGVTPLTTQQ